MFQFEVLFDILRYSMSSIFWGILIAIALMGLFVFLIKGWYKNALFTPASYLVGGVIFLLLSFQCTFIVGALKIISTTDHYESEVESLMDQYYKPYQEVTEEGANQAIQQLIDEYPLLEHYISGGEFTGWNADQLPHAIASELRSFMRSYIVRRLLWSLGFVVVGAVVVIKTMDLERNLGRRARQSRSNRPSAPMSNRQRPGSSRRRRV